MFGATVSTPLPLLLEVPLRLRLGLRLVYTALPLLLGVPRATARILQDYNVLPIIRSAVAQ